MIEPVYTSYRLCLMKPDHILVQGPVSRGESVRTRLAQLAWREGISAFVTNNVPFSFSSGRLLAGGLAHLIDALAEHDDVTVMELGAGIGYLSAFSLDALRDRFPEAYERSTFLVSDGEPSLVEAAESRGVLRDHRERSQFTIADLRDASCIVSHQPRLLILSYLLDAIPPVHVAKSEGVMETARVAPYVPEDCSVFDGRSWPPVLMRAEDIALVLQDEENVSPPLGRKLVSLLVEEWSWVEDQCLTSGSTLLHSRRQTIHDLCRILGQMPEESGIAITDFGYVDSCAMDLSEMMTEYGLCAFWAVAFDEIVEVADRHGFETYLHRGDEGQTHTLLIYSGSRGSRFLDAFVSGFEGMVPDRPGGILYNLEEDATLADIYEAIDRIEQTISNEEINLYGNLSRFAHLLLQFGDLEGAAAFSERCIERYPEVAAPEMAILGSVKGKKQELGAAEVLFKRAVELAPGLATPHLGLAGVCKAREEWESYFEHVKAYLATANCDVPEAMAQIAATLNETQLWEPADQANRWLEEYGT